MVPMLLRGRSLYSFDLQPYQMPFRLLLLWSSPCHCHPSLSPILLECLQWYFTLQFPLLQGLALEISSFLSSLGLCRLKQGAEASI